MIFEHLGQKLSKITAKSKSQSVGNPSQTGKSFCAAHLIKFWHFLPWKYDNVEAPWRPNLKNTFYIFMFAKTSFCRCCDLRNVCVAKRKLWCFPNILTRKKPFFVEVLMRVGKFSRQNKKFLQNILLKITCQTRILNDANLCNPKYNEDVWKCHLEYSKRNRSVRVTFPIIGKIDEILIETEITKMYKKALFIYVFHPRTISEIRKNI